jgi:hypothetical protein
MICLLICPAAKLACCRVFFLRTEHLFESFFKIKEKYIYQKKYKGIPLYQNLQEYLRTLIIRNHNLIYLYQ